MYQICNKNEKKVLIRKKQQNAQKCVFSFRFFLWFLMCVFHCFFGDLKILAKKEREREIMRKNLTFMNLTLNKCFDKRIRCLCIQTQGITKTLQFR